MRVGVRLINLRRALVVLLGGAVFACVMAMYQKYMVPAAASDNGTANAHGTEENLTPPVSNMSLNSDILLLGSSDHQQGQPDSSFTAITMEVRDLRKEVALLREQLASAVSHLQAGNAKRTPTTNTPPRRAGAELLQPPAEQITQGRAGAAQMEAHRGRMQGHGTTTHAELVASSVHSTGTHFQSLSHVKPFLGDFSLPGNLIAATKARAYKNELIIFVSDYGQGHFALNLILNLKRLGYGHYLMLGFNEEACIRMSALDDNLGCVWDGTFEPVVGAFSQTRIRPEHWRSRARHPELHKRMDQWAIRGDLASWVVRWKAFARLVAMGLNVMMLDTDTVVLEDVYKYLKLPSPLGQHQLLFHSEDHMDSYLQCGFVYCQNAHPRGAVAWVLAQVPMMFYRILDLNLTTAEQASAEQQWYLKAQTMESFFFDQNLMRDALASARVGVRVHVHFRAFYHSLAGEHTSHDALVLAFTHHLKTLRPNAVDIEWKDGWHVSSRRFPDEVEQRFFLENDERTFLWSNISVPERNDALFPDALRNATAIGLDEELGPLAGEFEALLEEDCSKPSGAHSDLESAANSAGAIAADGETVALLPQWVVCHWRTARRGHFSVEPAGGVVLHATNAADKLLMLTMLELYDYKAKKALLPNSFHHQVFVQERTVPVIAYHPDVDLRMTQEEYIDKVLHTLAVVAVLTGAYLLGVGTEQSFPIQHDPSRRRVAFPNVPCDSPWLKPMPNAPDPVRPSMLRCRTNLCDDWRIVTYGFNGKLERDDRHQRLNLTQSTGFHRNTPNTPVCAAVLSMIHSDGPARWNFGYHCNAAHDANGGKAFNPPDFQRYLKMVGERGSPQSGTNILFNTSRHEFQHGTRHLTVSKLAAELKLFVNEPIVYLPWAVSVNTLGEEDARVEEAARKYCQHTELEDEPLLHLYAPAPEGPV